MVWDGSGWLPPKSAEPETVAFVDTDLTDTFQFLARFLIVSTVISGVVLFCVVRLVVWLVTHE